MKPRNQLALVLTLIIAGEFSTASLCAKDTLQIDKAFLGATDSWRDVKIFLQDQTESDAVSITIAQPFTSIGGDPAPGQVKSLIVEYRLNGRPYRLLLKEQYPVAFTVKIPSPEAETPGANPEATAMMENISSFSNRQASLPPQYGRLLIYASACISLAALVFSVLALAQVRRLRARSKVPTDAA